MSAITTSLQTTQPKNIRPFDPRRDMNAVADLIETCFSDTLDPDGRRYIRQMRSAARGKGLNRWISMAASNTSLPLSGYVWEEAGEVVGNLSLVPFFHHGRRIYLIANVAVKENQRGRGIARSLTETALEKCRRRRVNSVWLQVRDNNPVALALYSKMRFELRVSRSTWVGDPKNLRGEVPPGVRVSLKNSRHWSLQKAWLNQSYPPALRWHIPLKMMSLQPGVIGALYRFFNEIDTKNWAVRRGRQLLGVLAWQGTYGYADRLWLAAPPENEAAVLSAVMPFIRREKRLNRPLSLNYPENRATDALMAAGFSRRHTLLWMELAS